MENYFGRLGQLWTILSTKFVWAEKQYALLFSFDVAFTNFHVVMHKLRDEDGVWYNRFYNRLIDIGETKKRTRTQSQSKYRKKRNARLSIGSRSTILDSDEETQNPE